MIPDTDNPRRDAILNAAFERFVNYGFRRTSMEDIANAAGMSRPALYQHFKNKSDIFRAYVEAMTIVMVEEVRQAFSQNGPMDEKLFCALERGFLGPHRKIAATPHGLELLGVNKEIAGDLFDLWMNDMESAIADGLRHSAERRDIAPGGSRDCAKLARLIINGVEGAKMRAGTPDEAEADIREIVKLVTAAERT
jgi:AcrR family transcriptional regulator